MRMALLFRTTLLTSVTTATAHPLPGCYIDHATPLRLLKHQVCEVSGPCATLTHEFCGHACQLLNFPSLGSRPHTSAHAATPSRPLRHSSHHKNATCPALAAPVKRAVGFSGCGPSTRPRWGLLLQRQRHRAWTLVTSSTVASCTRAATAANRTAASSQTRRGRAR